MNQKIFYLLISIIFSSLIIYKIKNGFRGIDIFLTLLLAFIIYFIIDFVMSRRKSKRISNPSNNNYPTIITKAPVEDKAVENFENIETVENFAEVSPNEEVYEEEYYNEEDERYKFYIEQQKNAEDNLKMDMYKIEEEKRKLEEEKRKHEETVKSSNFINELISKVDESAMRASNSALKATSTNDLKIAREESKNASLAADETLKYANRVMDIYNTNNSYVIESFTNINESIIQKVENAVATAALAAANATRHVAALSSMYDRCPLIENAPECPPGTQSCSNQKGLCYDSENKQISSTYFDGNNDYCPEANFGNVANQPYEKNGVRMWKKRDSLDDSCTNVYLDQQFAEETESRASEIATKAANDAANADNLGDVLRYARVAILSSLRANNIEEKPLMGLEEENFHKEDCNVKVSSGKADAYKKIAENAKNLAEEKRSLAVLALEKARTAGTVEEARQANEESILYSQEANESDLFMRKALDLERNARIGISSTSQSVTNNYYYMTPDINKHHMNPVVGRRRRKSPQRKRSPRRPSPVKKNPNADKMLNTNAGSKRPTNINVSFNTNNPQDVNKFKGREEPVDIMSRMGDILKAKKLM